MPSVRSCCISFTAAYGSCPSAKNVRSALVEHVAGVRKPRPSPRPRASRWSACRCESTTRPTSPGASPDARERSSAELPVLGAQGRYGGYAPTPVSITAVPQRPLATNACTRHGQEVPRRRRPTVPLALGPPVHVVARALVDEMRAKRIRWPQHLDVVDLQRPDMRHSGSNSAAVEIRRKVHVRKRPKARSRRVQAASPIVRTSSASSQARRDRSRAPAAYRAVTGWPRPHHAPGGDGTVHRPRAPRRRRHLPPAKWTSSRSTPTEESLGMSPPTRTASSPVGCLEPRERPRRAGPRPRRRVPRGTGLGRPGAIEGSADSGPITITRPSVTLASPITGWVQQRCAIHICRELVGTAEPGRASGPA